MATGQEGVRAGVAPVAPVLRSMPIYARSSGWETPWTGSRVVIGEHEDRRVTGPAAEERKYPDSEVDVPEGGSWEVPVGQEGLVQGDGEASECREGFARRVRADEGARASPSAAVATSAQRQDAFENLSIAAVGEGAQRRCDADVPLCQLGEQQETVRLTRAELEAQNLVLRQSLDAQCGRDSMAAILKVMQKTAASQDQRQEAAEFKRKVTCATSVEDVASILREIGQFPLVARARVVCRAVPQGEAVSVGAMERVRAHGFSFAGESDWLSFCRQFLVETDVAVVGTVSSKLMAGLPWPAGDEPGIAKYRKAKAAAASLAATYSWLGKMVFEGEVQGAALSYDAVPASTAQCLLRSLPAHIRADIVERLCRGAESIGNTADFDQIAVFLLGGKQGGQSGQARDRRTGAQSGDGANGLPKARASRVFAYGDRAARESRRGAERGRRRSRSPPRRDRSPSPRRRRSRSPRRGQRDTLHAHKWPSSALAAAATIGYPTAPHPVPFHQQQPGLVAMPLQPQAQQPAAHLQHLQVLHHQPQQQAHAFAAAAPLHPPPPTYPPPAQQGFRDGPRCCYNCGEPGHFSKDCPRRRLNGRR